MIDIEIVRTNPDRVRASILSRNAVDCVDDLLKIDVIVRGLQQEIDTLRHDLKSRSKGKPSDDERQILQELSRKIKDFESSCTEHEERRTALLITLPNMNDPETPIGPTEDHNVVAKLVGEKKVFDFDPVPYYELPSVKPYLKIEEGARTSGSRFYYLTGKLALLQKAVFRVAGKLIAEEGFEYVVPPLLVRERAMYGTGHFPADRFEIYHVNPAEDDLYLVGTAEVPLVSLHADETLDGSGLPKMYMAETTCFRREAGSYGKDQAGILRVHQFQKVEMVAFTTPEQSPEMHERIRALEEKIVAHFGLHYRVVDICSGDLGYPATRKWDIEAWFPAQKKYRELTSTSNTTDYQSRRLNIGYKSNGGQRMLAHTVNGTGVTDRLWLAILEQYQQADGSVLIPECLRNELPWEHLTA